MKKVYMVRHQKTGVDYRQAFSSYPTPEQQAPVIADLVKRTGAGDISVQEITLYEEGETPSFERPSGGLQVRLSGTGTVEPPK